MSKNTGTSELINYFDLGVNGDVGIAGSLDVNTIANATTDTDKFLVSDTGIIKYRTGAELLSDIGAAPAVAGGYLPLTGGILTGTTRMDGSGGTAPAITMIFNSGINRLLAPLLRLYGATNESSNYIELFGTLATSNRTINFPDASGTVALTSQIPANPVGGTGTSGTIPVFTGSTTIGNSIIQSNATQVNIVGNGSQLLFDSLGSTKDGGIGYTNSFDLLINNSRGVGSAIYLGNINMDFHVNVSGNPRLRITSGGNLLVGTTTDAGFKFDVNGTGRFSGALTSTLSSGIFLNNSSGGTNATQIRINNTSGDLRLGIESSTGQTIQLGTLAYAAVFGNQANNAVQFTTNGTARMTILGGGNVGIGTSSPIYPLHITSNIGDYTAAIINTNGSDNAGLLIKAGVNSGNSALRVQKGNGTDLFLVDASGNVGIGTPNVNAALHISSAGFGSTGRVFQWSGATTGTQYFDGANSGANLVWGMEGSSGGVLYVGASPYSAVFGNENNYPVQFGTNNAIRMTITSGGNVLIGTTTDTGAKLNVMGSYMNYPVSIEAMAGGGQLALTRGGAVAEFYMGGSTGGGTQLYVRSGGSGGVRLDAGSTGWVSASDIRLKDIKKPIEKAVESLSTLQTVYYSWKDSDNKSLHIGLIAQEVEKVFPELVSESSIDGMKGVNYTELIPVIIKAIQELNKKINA